MYITGVTCCVGRYYQELFRSRVSRWVDTLDELVVVTEPGEDFAAARCVQTDLFTRHGACFNKGASLSLGVQLAAPLDWVLTFDCDVLPPLDWRNKCVGISPNTLYGAVRRDEDTNQLMPPLNLPLGYFQLWHSSRLNGRPAFDCGYSHAGSYDMRLIESYQKHMILGIELLHKGPRRTNWFGPHEGSSQMNALKKGGLRLARALRIRDEHVRQIEKDILCVH